MIYVKKQDKPIAQVMDIPNFAPAEAIVVTLPVPIIYPKMKIPGPNEDEKIFLDNLSVKDVECELNTCVIISPNDGYDFAMAMSGRVKI